MKTVNHFLKGLLIAALMLTNLVWAPITVSTAASGAGDAPALEVVWYVSAVAAGDGDCTLGSIEADHIRLVWAVKLPKPAEYFRHFSEVMDQVSGCFFQ